MEEGVHLRTNPTEEEVTLEVETHLVTISMANHLTEVGQTMEAEEETCRIQTEISGIHTFKDPQ
jgi:hypothetical protein